MEKIYVNSIMNMHVETILRLTGYAITSFFMLKWASGDKTPAYDKPLAIIIMVGALLIHMNPKGVK